MVIGLVLKFTVCTVHLANRYRKTNNFQPVIQSITPAERCYKSQHITRRNQQTKMSIDDDWLANKSSDFQSSTKYLQNVILHCRSFEISRSSDYNGSTTDISANQEPNKAFGFDRMDSLDRCSSSSVATPLNFCTWTRNQQAYITVHNGCVRVAR